MKKLAIIFSLSCLLLAACQNPAVKTAENKAANSASNTNSAKPVASNLPAMPAEILNAEMKTLEGKPFKLSESSGKVLLVNMWATWCAPCIKEMPEIEKINAEFKDKGFEAISVTSIDEENTDKQVRDFLAEKKFTYKQVLADKKTFDAMAEASKGPGIPVNFIISKDGKIVDTLIGGKTYEVFKAAVEKGLNR
jgi:thiol-disulfide isomerase/thioredoxin